MTYTAKDSKILFVVNACGFFVSHRLPIALAAARIGYEVHVAAADDETSNLVREHGLQFHPVNISRAGRNPLREVSTFFQLYRLFRDVRPDVVHLVTIKPVIYGGIAARLAGIDAVVGAIPGLGYLFTERGYLSRVMRAMALLGYRIALRHPRLRVIFQNQEDMSEFLRRGIVERQDTVLIKGSGVAPDQFVPVPPSDGVPVVVLAARMLWDKGVGEFVEAARLLQQDGVSARFVLAGGIDSNPSAIPESQLLKWHREGVVEWWGHQKDMPDVFRRTTIACLPSYREGLPKVLIEAAASGLPIVATDVPGCRDICRHGENGLLVPPRNALALAEALRFLIDSPNTRLAMGRRSREIFEAEYTIDQVVDRTLRVYSDVLSSPRG